MKAAINMVQARLRDGAESREEWDAIRRALGQAYRFAAKKTATLRHFETLDRSASKLGMSRR